jgi:hypothetical protein
MTARILSSMTSRSGAASSPSPKQKRGEPCDPPPFLQR